MKVAVCVSGIMSSNNNSKWHKNITEHFPYHVFYHTWNDSYIPTNLPTTVMTSSQPNLTVAYNTKSYLDSNMRAYETYIKTLDKNNPTRILVEKSYLRDNKASKFQSSFFQFFSYWHCLQMIPEKYDMIIRVRPDVILYHNNWERDIEISYKQDKVFGFSKVKTNKKLNYTQMTNMFCNDFVILHKRYRMKDPYKSQTMPGEIGWWLLLSNSATEIFEKVNNFVTLEKYQ